MRGGRFCVKQTHKMTGRREGWSRKSICKPSLGRLLFSVLYKVNGNQGATIPEASPPLILNNEIKMGSLYPGAALASRPLGNKTPCRPSLDLKAQPETFICTEHLARRCEKGLFFPLRLGSISFFNNKFSVLFLPFLEIDSILSSVFCSFLIV